PLVAVVPVLLRGGADVGLPAVGQLAGGVVEAAIVTIGRAEVSDGGLEEIAGDVSLMLGAVVSAPPLWRAVAVALGAEGEAGLEVSIRLLRCQQQRDPLLQLGA